MIICSISVFEFNKVRFVICALVSVLGTLLITLIVLGHQDSKYNAERDDLYTSFKQDGVLYDILLKTGNNISAISNILHYHTIHTFHCTAQSSSVNQAQVEHAFSREYNFAS